MNCQTDNVDLMVVDHDFEGFEPDKIKYFLKGLSDKRPTAIIMGPKNHVRLLNAITGLESITYHVTEESNERGIKNAREVAFYGRPSVVICQAYGRKIIIITQ